MGKFNKIQIIMICICLVGWFYTLPIIKWLIEETDVKFKIMYCVWMFIHIGIWARNTQTIIRWYKQN
jgi:hypothetical protein